MPAQRRHSEQPRIPLESLPEDEVVSRRRFSEDHRKASPGDITGVLNDLRQMHLSQAGIRKLSDVSVVLTDDTDSFIIGDRVWVGGSKAGHISYIGETQFAPGEWAGVTLDDDIGKNDGSVGGVRYFQCEPKKGVFSRLTRLSREPLTGDDIDYLASSQSSTRSTYKPSNISAHTMSSASVPPSTKLTSMPIRKVSPMGGNNTLVKTSFQPPSSNVATPVRKTSNPSSASLSFESKIGDRVVISSVSGVRFGILRFVGKTEFAEGTWAGVELDEPTGKNDGTVAGKRYFDCKNKFGLFAPLNRVSKFTGGTSPPRPISSTPSSVPRSGSSTLRTSGSRESLGGFSVASSTASSVHGVKKSSKVPTSSVPSSKALQQANVDDDEVDQDGFY